jgi:hypothetical protein
MNGLLTGVNLNILPSGSYDVLICMDWLASHKVRLDCSNNNFEGIDDEGKPSLVKGTLRYISIIYISALQLKRSFQKGC